MNLYNLLFGILLTAGLAVGVYAVGPAALMDEARSLVGMEEETPVFVRPSLTAAETPEAAPVNPASVPAEEPAVAPETTQASAFDPQGLQFGARWSASKFDVYNVGLEVFESPRSLEPMEWNVYDDYFQFPDDAYAVYRFHVSIRNTTDTPITFPLNVVNLRFLEFTDIPDTYEYHVVSGPHSVRSTSPDSVWGAGSVTIAPNDDSGFSVWFSVPVKEVDPRNAFNSVYEPTVFFGDIGPLWALTRERSPAGGLVIVRYNCYGNERCDY